LIVVKISFVKAHLHLTSYEIYVRRKKNYISKWESHCLKDVTGCNQGKCREL